MLNNEVLLAGTMTVSVARLCIIKVARIRVGEFLTTKYNREYEECDCVCSKVKKHALQLCYTQLLKDKNMILFMSLQVVMDLRSFWTLLKLTH